MQKLVLHKVESLDSDEFIQQHKENIELIFNQPKTVLQIDAIIKFCTYSAIVFVSVSIVNQIFTLLHI